MSEDFFTWGHAASAVVGGGAAYVWGVVKKYLDREQKGTDLARDALVDLALTLRGAERTFGIRLRETPDLTEAAGVSALRGTFHSDSYLFATTLPESKFLGVFDGDELNKRLILFFDHHRRYKLYSELRQKTFLWLLDEENWTSEAAKERIVHFNTATAGMTTHVLGMLRHGHQAALVFYRRCRSHVSIRAEFSESTAPYLEAQFGWTDERLERRCNYYEQTKVEAVFEPEPAPVGQPTENGAHLVSVAETTLSNPVGRSRTRD
jgi:hypothetical protein